MTRFTWVINQLNCLISSEGLQDVINVIHWTYVATETDDTGKEWIASMYGTANVEQPNPQNFIPYEDVTYEEVCGWLDQVLPTDDMKASLEANIYNQQHPTEVTLPLPWATPSENSVENTTIE
jgi:hypothetical protein